MAIYDTSSRILCNKCGGSIFTEHETYIYDVNADNSVTRTDLEQKILICIKCNNSIEYDRIVDKSKD